MIVSMFLNEGIKNVIAIVNKKKSPAQGKTLLSKN